MGPSIRDVYVDLTILPRGFTGVSIYASNLAIYFERTFDCKVLVPPYLDAHFQNAVICPEPIYFKRGLVCRHPLWRRRSGVGLGERAFVYAPHMRGHIAQRNQILTIHDLISHRYPTRNVIENIFNAHVLPSIIQSATGIITVSQASRVEIAQYFKIDSERIAVVGNGLDLARWKPLTRPPINREPPYLLTVSANRPYKNTIELIANHDLWSGRFRLKIVSSRTSYGAVIRQAVSEANLLSIVDFIDDLPEDCLIDLYQRCAAVVYPSLLEGFGRPALEALSVGRPVILSDIPAHREIFAGAAVFFTPGDRESWKAAFSDIDTVGKMAELRAAALPIVQQYGWESVGQQLKATLLRFEPQLSNFLR